MSRPNIEFVFKIRGIDNFKYQIIDSGKFTTYELWESDTLNIFYPHLGNEPKLAYGKKISSYINKQLFDEIKPTRTIVIIDGDDDKLIDSIKKGITKNIKFEFFLSFFFKIDFKYLYLEKELPTITKFSIYNDISSPSIPIIRSSDPIAKLIGAKPGDEIKFDNICVDRFGAQRYSSVRCVPSLLSNTPVIDEEESDDSEKGEENDEFSEEEYIYDQSSIGNESISIDDF